jgi:hypothetical protein
VIDPLKSGCKMKFRVEGLRSVLRRLNGTKVLIGIWSWCWVKKGSGFEGIEWELKKWFKR